MTQAAWQAEKAVGHGDNAVTQQDVTNTNQSQAGDDSESMKALVWQGVNKVEVGRSFVRSLCGTSTNNAQSTSPNLESSKTAMSSSKLPAAQSAAPTYTSSTVPSSSSPKATSWATNSVVSSNRLALA